MASITIVGGGIFGLCCAWELTRRGATVRVVEARHIGAGSSGGTVGALAPHVPDNWNEKKAFQLDSLLMAPGFWAEVEAASGIPTGYGRHGRLQPVPDMATADKLAERIAAAGRQWPAGIGMRLIRDAGAVLLPQSPTGLWLHDDLTARIAPRAALASVAAALRVRGVPIDLGQPAGQPDGTVIWATGAEGLADLSADLGRKIGQGVKGQSVLLGFDAPGQPQIFADGLHIVPHEDGTVAIGSTSENSFEHGLPDDQAQDLLARARAICPALADAPVLDIWAGIRPRAQSRAPLLGAWPGRPGHYVANGGFKIGFGMAPGIAHVMADLVLTGSADMPDGFRLT